MPAAAAYGLVMVYPTLTGILAAFTDWTRGTDGREWNDFENFVRLANDPAALLALRNTLILAVFVTVIQTLIGFGLAALLSRPMPGRSVFRLLFFLPVALAPITVAYLWQYTLGYDGTLNAVLRAIGLESAQADWLADPATAIWWVGVVVIWQYSGTTMLIFLAGMQSIPEEVYEAADLDGASRLQSMIHITIPLIRPALLLNLVFTTIGSIRIFDQVFVMTGGGPGDSTQTLSTLLYRQAFSYGEFGYAAAIALVLTVICFGIGIVQARLINRTEA